MYYVVFWSDCAGRDSFEIVESEAEAVSRYSRVLRKPNLYCAGWTPIYGGDGTDHWAWGENTRSTAPLVRYERSLGWLTAVTQGVFLAGVFGLLLLLLGVVFLP